MKNHLTENLAGSPDHDAINSAADDPPDLMALAFQEDIAERKHAEVQLRLQGGAAQRRTSGACKERFSGQHEPREPYAEAALPVLAPAVAQSSGARLSGLRILAAEDSEINRLVLEEILIEEGVSLSCVENGLLAVEQVVSDGADAWDLVLMDIMMPVMDGYEAARCLRDVAPDLPIIGLTVHALDEERAKCLASGMLEHVAKPIDIDLLIDAIQRHARWPAAAYPKPRFS